MSKALHPVRAQQVGKERMFGREGRALSGKIKNIQLPWLPKTEQGQIPPATNKEWEVGEMIEERGPQTFGVRGFPFSCQLEGEGA